MEVDFDKEIDTLLRKAHHDGPVLVGNFASSSHLDADEISAFAENAMPEKSRALHMAHLADCDRCRKILSNLLVMNAEEAPATASPLSAVTLAGRSVPWYRSLFLFPNLAYAMGSLVLIFGGFLAFTVIRNSNSYDAGMVSQVADDKSTGSGPSYNSEPLYPSEFSNSNMAANVTSNTAAAPSAMMSNSNASMATRSVSENAPVAGPRAGENNFVIGETPTADATSASPPPPPPSAAGQPALKDARERDDNFKAKAEDKVTTDSTLQEAAKKNDAIAKMQSPGALSQNQIQSGPMNRSERRYNRQLENLDRGAARAKGSVRRDEESGSGAIRRVVSGKTFERKQGVWYDTTYQGRPTINVRRGSDEFNRLDGGLRSIANSFTGIVVVVWDAKAYRIQ